MGLQVGRPPDHSFDEPLGLLSDCHRRIEHFLHVLVVVATRSDGGPLIPDYRKALEGAARYFTVAAPRHTADEEESLFPRLRATGDPAAAHALALIDRLQRDHEEADAHHAAVDALVRRWLADDRLAAEDLAALRQHLTRLQAIYLAHIRVEDAELFPAAARLLEPRDIQEIGREMAARRR